MFPPRPWVVQLLCMVLFAGGLTLSSDAATVVEARDSLCVQQGEYAADPSCWPPPPPPETTTALSRPVVPYRGGSLPVVPPPMESSSGREELNMLMDLEHMALSLRYTGEVNRRLDYGISHLSSPLQKTTPDRKTKIRPTHQNAALGQRGGTSAYPMPGQGGPVGSPAHVVAPSQPWHPPIPMFRKKQPMDLTLFHAKSVRTSNRKKGSKIRVGSSRWGPPLDVYLKYVTEALQIENSPIILALAMIYLDRACSVETPRTSTGTTPVGPTPCITPRTVHRLIMVALLIATKVVKGGSTAEYWHRLQSLGIPLEQLEQMESWMMGAMGDLGLYVEKERVYKWIDAFHQTFSPKSRQQQQRPKIRISKV